MDRKIHGTWEICEGAKGHILHKCLSSQMKQLGVKNFLIHLMLQRSSILYFSCEQTSGQGRVRTEM